MANVHEFLRYVVDKKASDLHVKAGGPPYVRINGHLSKTDFPPLSAADCERAAMELMNDEQARRFKQVGEVDFAYSEQGLGRFRVNVFRQRGSVGMACRRVSSGQPVVRDPRTSAGDQGSGRRAPRPVAGHRARRRRGRRRRPERSSTTSTRRASCHILTIEDPIEILHADREAIVNQREIGHDTADFAIALACCDAPGPRRDLRR